MTPQIEWLLESDEPWTRYRALIDLLDRDEDDPEVLSARAEMIAHPQVAALIEKAAGWPGYALKRHSDAKHPLYTLSTLADFGLRADDPGVQTAVDTVLAHQSDEGAFQTLVRLYKRFGGMEGEYWTWMACDAPTLLYALLAFGLCDHPQVQIALDHLLGLVDENGWRCAAAPELCGFHGPGRKDDPCPIANVYALKALTQVPDLVESPAANKGVEMLLWHWTHQKERKLYLFGIGTDFRKLKYPLVWYNLLHVVDVLSQFPQAHGDPRFEQMVTALRDQADEQGRYTATSMYRAWKGWSFADKKSPSPWLTFLVLRILKRLGRLK
jgi:hypothetical protein